MFEQRSSPTEDLPDRQNLILSASFDKDGEDPPGVAAGMLSLCTATPRWVRGIRTQPGKFMIAGEGLCIGRDSGAGVTDISGNRAVALHGRNDQPRGGRCQRRAVPRLGARGPAMLMRSQ